MNVIVVGAGIGGLTLALELHEAGIACRVYEAAPEIGPVGVGINVLPHATRVLADLGLEQSLAEVGITTGESVFFNRFGQLIYREPCGRYAGYSTPQFSLHRADLHTVLLEAVHQRLGPDAVVLGHRCTGVSQDRRGVRAHFVTEPGAEPLPDQPADALVGCDGIHSAVRRQLHPDEGEPIHAGVTMWRGVTRWQPFLSGASMVRAGWLSTGKMVIYPVRDAIDEHGNQLVNWVAEREVEKHIRRSWNRPGNLDDFIEAFEDWHFDWLDVPALIRASDEILEYPMVDQEPLPWWTADRITLLGDAAHPMVPRGSNGAGQAVLDARALREALLDSQEVVDAFKVYERRRLPATAAVVRKNRETPPDAILREVWRRTGDRPFDRIDDIISPEELQAISESYKQVAGYPSVVAARRAP